VNYKQTAPCDLCPFRRDSKGLRLTPARAREFGLMMLSNPGSEFVCHKTAKLDEDEDGIGDYVDAGEVSAHCAGALIFAEKNGRATQMMRIAERLGMYDHRKLKGHEQVFDNLDEMVEAQDKPLPKAPRRKRSKK
jgi:hypothetical protein